MDTFLTTQGSAHSRTNLQPDKTIKTNPYPTVKFVRESLADDVGAAYDALPVVNQHAFRIAYEQLGSSFDFRQCGM